jgi:hypothetical protein
MDAGIWRLMGIDRIAGSFASSISQGREIVHK